MNKQLNYINTQIENHCSEPRSKLLNEFIEKLGDRFLKAPASSRVRYHHAKEGGLIEHIQEVHEYLRILNEKLRLFSEESSLTVAVLHDIRKCGDASGNEYYIPNMLKKGRSEAEPYKTNKETYLKVTGDVETEFLMNECSKFSDGESALALIKSVSLELFDSLTVDEIQAIRFHDLGFGKGKYDLNGNECALTILLHTSDMLSSRSKNWTK